MLLRIFFEKRKDKGQTQGKLCKTECGQLKKNGVRSKVGTVKTSRRKAGRWRSDFDTDLWLLQQVNRQPREGVAVCMRKSHRVYV
jgi:hypothetical protein